MRPRVGLAAVVLACAPIIAAAQQPTSAPAPRSARAAPSERPKTIGQLEAAVKREPNNPARYIDLGLAYWSRNDYPRALAAFQRAVKVGPRSAEAHNWLGVALSEKADLPGAVAAFKQAIALDPKFGRAYTNFGAALAKGGEFGEAAKVFQQALALEPNSLGARLNLGRALRETGDFDGALQHLRQVAAGDPDNPDVHYELGQTLRQRGDLPGAAAAFERAIAIDPERRDAYYALGTTLRQQSATARAAAASTSSGKEGDQFTRAQEALGRGDLQGARDLLTEVLRLDERHAEAHNLLGFLFGQQGDLPGAIGHVERAIALRPEFAEAHYNLGVARWYASERDTAVSELRKSATLDPAAGGTHAFLGTALRETGDLAGARVSLQRAIALLPPTAAIYVDLGIVFLRAGDLDKALGQLEAGLNLPSPSLPTPDWEDAIAGVRQAIAANAARPAVTSGAAHDVLGLLLGRAGADSQEVAAAFRDAIRLRPDFAAAHNHLGLVLIQSSDDQGGIAALRTAVRLQPEDAEARTNLGAALTPIDATEAIRELEKAVALAPTYATAQYNLAMAYGASPTVGSAKQIAQLRGVIALAPTFARAHLALGKALLQENDATAAIDALREATRLEPKNGEATYQLGLALARAGRKDEATTTLQKGRELIAADERAQNVARDLAESRAALNAGDLDRAAASARHALQLQPESQEARRALDAVEGRRRDRTTQVAELEDYIRQGKYKEAEPLLAAYVKAHPESSWGWYALGYSQFAQQKLGEAIQALAKSLERDIRNAEAHKILGRTLMIIGRFDAAQLEFEQGIRYKPDSAELHYNLGKLLSMQDNWEPARKAFEAALKIDPTYVEAIDALGFALEALGDDAGAVKKYEEAIAVNDARKGTFAAAHVNLSAYYNRSGDAAKALGYARTAIELDPKSDRAWFQKAKADEREGRMPDAIAALNRAIVLNPRASSYHYVLSGLYRRTGDLEESKKALEVFQRLERESSELEKKRRSAPGSAASTPGARRD